jgi:hypothetical protein
MDDSLYPPQNVYALDIAALVLYERLGCRYRNAFGDYPEDPAPVFMQKTVADAAG